MEYEPITDPVYWNGKKKIIIRKNQKSKASGSGEKGSNPITKRPRNPYRKTTPYVSPYLGNSAWDVYVANGGS